VPPSLAFHVLGPLGVTAAPDSSKLRQEWGDGAQELPQFRGVSPTARVLLCRLLLSPGQVVPADRLAADVGLAGGVGLLEPVTELRWAIDDGDGTLLVHDGAGYRLAVRPEAIDAVVFDRQVSDGRAVAMAAASGAGLDGPVLQRYLDTLDAALGLWRGPAFADVADREWAAPEASRLDELRAATVEDRADVLLALGRHAELVPELEVAVVEEPVRERRARQLAVALYRTGREPDALAALDRVRRDLFDQLSVAPTEALAELEHGIRRHHPALAPPRCRPG
jgi:DNA-binding SARP family transcriptional activator